MEQAHHHPLNASSICCPEHVFELISIYTQQNREDETLSILLFFSENMETHFLLDNSESSQDLKQKLGRFYNKFALKKTLNPLTMHQLLDTSFNLLSSLPDSTDNLGYLATATSNLAFIAKEEGDLEKAVKLLDKALSIDKKLEDGAGEIITRINKAAVLNEMAAFREAFFTVKDCFAKLDKKVTEYIRSVSEKELKNSKKFKETLQLFLVASVNLLKALENIDDTSLISEARSKKQKSYDLSLKYLGESHQLTNFFCEPLRSDRTFSSFGSNLDLSFHQSSKDYSNTSQQSEKKKPEKRVSEKTPLFSQSSFSSKDPRPTPKLQKSEKPENLKKSEKFEKFEKKEKNEKKEKTEKKEKKEKIEKPEKLQLSDERSDRSGQSLLSRQAKSEKSDSSKVHENHNPSNPEPFNDHQNESQEIKKGPLNKTLSNKSIGPEFIRRKISKNSFKSSNNSPLSASNSEDLSLKSRVIRLPGSSLPFIPFRRCHLKSRTFWKFSSLPNSKSFEYLLDPLKSPISKQFDFNIAGIKIVNHLKRVIICCLEINNNQPNLAITATSEESIEELFTSESINLNDLKRILFFLCIDDVMPSYMHPGFVNSFEKFCRFFLMPFIRIVEVQENNSEKIELWARGESLMNDASQIFLNTECNVFLFFVEKFSLKLVVCNAADEEPSEKSLRVDVIFDEISGNTFIVNHEIPVIYNNTRFVPCIEPFSENFLEHLDPILSEVELCVKDEFGPRVTFDEFLEKNNFLMIRASFSGANYEKVLWTIQDNRAKRGWDIKIKTLHIGSSVRSKAYRLAYFYPYNTLHLNFGVFVDQLENSQIRILAYFVLESLKVEASVVEDLSELDTSASVIVMPVKSLKSFRGFSKNTYKAPVTLSVVGVNNYLIGIRVSLFNVETCAENSAWLVLDGNFYKLDQPKVKKIEKPKGVLSVKLHETKLLEILEKEKGWEKVMACVRVDKNSIFVVGLQGESLFESLENVLIKGK